MKKNYSRPLFSIQCYEDRQQSQPLKVKLEDISLNGTVKDVQSKRDTSESPPPPPPPMPIIDKNGEFKKVDSNNTVPKISNSNVIINNKNIINGSLKRTPTPDYIDKTEIKTQVNGKNHRNEKLELDSIESYKLKNPVNGESKPPSTYFMRAPNGTATMKKHIRPVSVTIGEYPGNGAGRREPSKLEFLNGTDKVDGRQVPEDIPISNRLQSELALTLSRSNLRKKTETWAGVGR